MKKPVLVIIALIYILAIAVVGFLGIPARIFNPKTFVEDIQLTFDDKLTPMELNEIDKTDPEKRVDYKFKIRTSTAVSFYVSAKPLPNEVTDKLLSFERIDRASFCTMSEPELKGDYTTATFTCAALPAKTVKNIYFKVRPTDGNYNLVKYVKIIVQNI